MREDLDSLGRQLKVVVQASQGFDCVFAGDQFIELLPSGISEFRCSCYSRPHEFGIQILSAFDEKRMRIDFERHISFCSCLLQLNATEHPVSRSLVLSVLTYSRICSCLNLTKPVTTINVSMNRKH